MIENTKNAPSAPSEALAHNDGFHYWQGESRNRYIFSVYRTGTCPPLPGAVYVIAKRDHDHRCCPLAVGRFSELWETADRQAARLLKMTGGDEFHVHLLADDNNAAEAVVRDLKPILGSTDHPRAGKEIRAGADKFSDGIVEHQEDPFALDQAA